MSHLLPDAPLKDVYGKMAPYWYHAVSIANPGLSDKQIEEIWEAEVSKQETEIDVAVGLKWPPQYPDDDSGFRLSKFHILAKHLHPFARKFLEGPDWDLLRDAGYFG